MDTRRGLAPDDEGRGQRDAGAGEKGSLGAMGLWARVELEMV